MAADKAEIVRRGLQKPKYSSSEKFIKIEWRVMDNDAFKDLSSSAVRLLLVMTRQLNGSNNGQLQATYSYAARYGFGSEHTLKDAIAQLISHGFIYRTRSHGANGAWARYALTWLPIQDKTGLFLTGFVKDGWRNWVPEIKAHPKKCRSIPAESAVSPPRFQQKVQEPYPQKVQSMNILPCSAVFRASSGMLYRSLAHRVGYRYAISGRGRLSKVVRTTASGIARLP